MTAKTQYNSLSARLIVSILLIIFVPSFIGLAILGMKTRDDFRRQTITHLRDGLEIKSVTATDKLHLTITSLRLATKRVKMELDASEGLALRLSLGEAPKEWYDDKLYRKLYTLLKNEISKHSGITEAKIINSSGNELIRLVLTPSGIEEKAPGELENKAHRKYFKNMMSLPGGRIKINPVSLQREHKQIVRPYMPVLRIGGKITLTVPLRRGLTPKASATGASGTMAAQADEINFGIVIFNIKSEYIFGMRTSRKGSGFMVTDEKGYYLVHPEENALWGDELGTSANLFKDEPEIRENSSLKNAILNRDKGIQYNQIHDDYNVWRKIRYDELNPSRYWLLFQKGRKDSIEAQWEQVVKNGFAWFALIILTGFVVLALVVTKALRPLTEVADAMKRLEDGDLSARAVAKSRTEIGKITHAFNSMADWLEKYRSELQKSLAISCAMSDTAPNAHIVIKQDGKILSANRAAERIFDYSVDELSGKDIKILMPKPYNEKEEDYVWDDLGMGIDRIVGFGMKELNAMRNGGEVFRVSVYLGKAKIANEAVLLAVISDISERKRTVAALLENEQKYRNLFTNANDAIYLIDPVTAKIIDCNRKAAEITGYDMDKLKTMTVLDLLPEENRNLIPRLFQEVMDKGAVTDISDLHHKKKDGSLVPIEINASIIEIGGKRLYLSIVRNITERKRAEGNLQRRNKFIKLLQEISSQANESKSIEETLQFCIDKICALTSWPVGHVYMVSGDKKDTLGPTSIWCSEDQEHYRVFHDVTMNTDFIKGVGLPGRVLATGKPAWIIDVMKDPNFPRATIAQDIGVKAGFAFPILVRDEVAAVLEFFSPDAREPDEQLLEIMVQVGTQAGRVIERTRAERVINNIAKGISAETGEEFFRSLVRYLAENLDSSYAFIGELTGKNSDSINTIAVYANGEIRNNFEYTLAGTPCINVVGKVSCVYQENVQKEFPDDRLLVEMGVESYIGTPLFDSAGNALGLLVVMDRKPLQNGTLAGSMLQIFAARASAELERKKAEDELIASEAKYRTLMDNASDAIGLCAIDGTTLEVNGQMEKLTGYTKEELIGKKFQTFLPKSVAEKAFNSFKNVIEKGSGSLFEGAIARKDGVEVPVEVTSSMVEYEGRRVVQSSIRDVTERKRAEEALRKSEESLVRAQEIANVGNWNFDIVSKNITWSDQSYRIYGFRPREVTPTFQTFQNLIHPDDRDRVNRAIKMALNSDKPYDIEFRIIRKDGTERAIHSQGKVEFDKKGRPVRMFGVAGDITEQKRAEEALIEAKQVAEKANEAKTRFVATTNHELRNPLTSMISMLKLIVSGTCESPEQEKEFLKNVYNSSVHLRGLIEHLLDLSVIESGKLKMNMRSVRIDDLLELVRQITWIQAEEKGLELTFTCDCEKDNRMVYCDPDRLRELLVNLVNNAIKFTEKGSVRVTCRVPDKDNMRTLEIIDTGIGIEPDKLKEVFKPFVQAEGRQYGGGGLGLTLAKKLVLAMGGDISIESKGPGHGTKVTLTLPLAPVENKNKKKNKTG